MKNFDNMRHRLLAQAGIRETAPNASPAEIERDIADRHAELDKVVALAKNRLAVGTYRYGTGANHGKYDYRARLNDKLALYDASRNKEFLVDVLNYCALEFHHPSRAGTFFSAMDTDDGSTRVFDF